MPAQQEGECKDADEASQFAHGRRNSMAGGAHSHWGNFRGVDERRRIRSKFGKEETDSVDDNEWHCVLFKIRNQGHRCKRNRHHNEPQHLDRFTAELIHCERCYRVAGCGEHNENRKVSHRLAQQRIIGAKRLQHKRAGYLYCHNKQNPLRTRQRSRLSDG